MKSQYQLLNEKLERDIDALQKKINKQIHLIEVSIFNQGGIALEGGIDPAFNGNVQPTNKGYVAGLASGNSNAIVANPSVVGEVSKEKEQEKTGKKVGRFGFDKTPVKPLTTDTLGLGMGIGLDSKSFDATKSFVQQYAPDIKLDLDQEKDPNAVAYLSWKAVNTAVSNRDTQVIRGELQKWGLYDPNTGNIPNAIGDQYYTQDVATAFAKKLKQAEDTIAGKSKSKISKVKEKGKTVTQKVKKITKK